MAEEMFDGFDHTRYEEEVVERWGRDAYDRGDRWWRTLSDADKTGFQQDQLDIAAEFGRAHAAGLAPDSPEVLAITRRHYEWVAAGWQDRRPTADAFAGLGEMYVSDPRFAKHYDRHGPAPPSSYGTRCSRSRWPCRRSAPVRLFGGSRRHGKAHRRGVAYPVFRDCPKRAPAVRRSVRPHHRRIRILRTDDRRKGRDAARVSAC